MGISKTYNRKDLISKVKEWNVNLEKHSPYIPYTQTDKDVLQQIVQIIKLHNEKNN